MNRVESTGEVPVLQITGEGACATYTSVAGRLVETERKRAAPEAESRLPWGELMRIAREPLLVAVMLVLLGSSGCTYLGNRGRDALDIFDAGILVSDHGRPDFAAFLNFWNVLPMGYAHVEGRLIGVGDGRVGVLEFQHRNSWGVVAWGAEQHAAGESGAAPTRYDQGFARLALGAERTPPGHQYFDCDRTFHLGWIGLHLRIKLDDLADFILGWAGADIMNDDRPPASRQRE